MCNSQCLSLDHCCCRSCRHIQQCTSPLLRLGNLLQGRVCDGYSSNRQLDSEHLPSRLREPAKQPYVTCSATCQVVFVWYSIAMACYVSSCCVDCVASPSSIMKRSRMSSTLRKHIEEAFGASHRFPASLVHAPELHPPSLSLPLRRVTNNLPIFAHPPAMSVQVSMYFFGSLWP